MKQRFTKRSYLIIVLGFSLLTTVTNGQENRLRWNGFVSVVGGTTLGDKEQYMADPPSNGVYDDRVSFVPDTIFGLQAQLDLDDGLTATAQIVARGGDEFASKFEWAYLTYALTDEWSITAGRTRVPLFKYSTSLDVGYSYHWIRPPGEVYSTAFTGFEGAKFCNTTTFGDFDSRLEIFGGRTEASAPPLSNPFLGDVSMVLAGIHGFTWELGYDDWIQTRAIYLLTSADFSGSNVGTISAGNHTRFYGAALAFDLDSWFVEGEFNRLQFEDTFNHRNSWYVSSGLRLGSYTPHLTYSELREMASDRPAKQQKTLTAGIRCEFHPSAAWKLEYSKVQDQSDSGTALKGDSDLIAVGIDLVF